MGCPCAPVPRVYVAGTVSWIPVSFVLLHDAACTSPTYSLVSTADPQPMLHPLSHQLLAAYRLPNIRKGNDVCSPYVFAKVVGHPPDEKDYRSKVVGMCLPAVPAAACLLNLTLFQSVPWNALFPTSGGS